MEKLNILKGQVEINWQLNQNSTDQKYLIRSEF